MDPTFSNAGYHELKSIIPNTATSVSLTVTPVHSIAERLVEVTNLTTKTVS